MECRQWREELKSWLEAAWAEPGGAELPDGLASHARGCADCAERLAGARLLLGGESLRETPAPWLAERIAARLEREQLRPVGARRPLAHGLRMAVLPAAAVLLAAVTVALTLTFSAPDRAGAQVVIVRLVLEAPQAGEVAVVGDWNGWDPQADRLTDADGDGVWEAEIRIRKGQEYQYQFLLDREEWVPDPRSPLQVEDGFGGANSVLQI